MWLTKLLHVPWRFTCTFPAGNKAIFLSSIITITITKNFQHWSSSCPSLRSSSDNCVDWQSYLKKAVNYFCKKNFHRNVRLGSKYTSENFRFSSKGYSCKFQTIRSSPPEVFWGKVVLKICSKFTEEHPCWSVISIKLLCIALIALLRSHFGMGVLL